MANNKSVRTRTGKTVMLVETAMLTAIVVVMSFTPAWLPAYRRFGTDADHGPGYHRRCDPRNGRRRVPGWHFWADELRPVFYGQRFGHDLSVHQHSARLCGLRDPAHPGRSFLRASVFCMPQARFARHMELCGRRYFRLSVQYRFLFGAFSTSFLECAFLRGTGCVAWRRGHGA